MICIVKDFVFLILEPSFTTIISDHCTVQGVIVGGLPSDNEQYKCESNIYMLALAGSGPYNQSNCKAGI